MKETNSKSIENSNFKNNIFKVVFSVCLILLVTAGVIIFAIKVFSTKSDKYLLYTENSMANYSVLLKENKYYDVTELPSDMNYIASLIDIIKLKFDYIFTSTKGLYFNNNYYIEAVTRVYADKDKSKVLFEKSEILKDKVDVSKNNIQYYAFQENVEIDYAHFNSFAIAFKNDYALNTVSDLTISLKLKTSAENGEFVDKINLNSESSIVIPLSEQTVNVSIKSNNIDKKNCLYGKFGFEDINMKDLIIMVILSIIDILLLIKLVIIVIKYLNSISEYDKKLNKILREYDNIIANVSYNIPIENYQKVLFVNSFQELLDIHDNLGIPILFNEIEDGVLSSFTIINEDVLYRYILKNR